MKVVIAIDSFKGSLSSLEAGEAAAVGVRRAFPDAECVVRPLADGGEGSVDCFLAAMKGEKRYLRVSGPFYDPVDTYYGVFGDTAVIHALLPRKSVFVRKADSELVNFSGEAGTTVRLPNTVLRGANDANGCAEAVITKRNIQ